MIGQTRLTRANLLLYIESQSYKLKNPSYHDSKIGVLKRFFDEIPSDGYGAYVPDNIKQHLKLLKTANENNTMKLWCFRLAAMVQAWFIDERGHFLADITEKLTSHNIDRMRLSFLSYRMDAKEVENCFCQAYIFFIVQHAPALAQDVELARNVRDTINSLSFVVPGEIDNFCKVQLLKNFKLNKQKESNLKFWQSQVDLSLFNRGGKEILFSPIAKYRVPTGIYKIMTALDSFSGGFDDLCQLIIGKNQKRRKALIIGDRHMKTERFYQLNSCELATKKIKSL